MSKLHWWRFIHNCIAHPALFFSNDARWAVRFHDWSSHKMHGAYPKLYMRVSVSGESS